jgi:hypothetical protein
MPANVSQKAKAKVSTVQSLQSSLGIQGPSALPGRGAGRQTIPESLGLGRTAKRTATKIGRNHLRDSMGL